MDVITFPCSKLNYVGERGPKSHYNIQHSEVVHIAQKCWKYIMMSSNGNIFCVTGPLWGETTSDWWIPLTKAIDAEHWCFLWSALEQTVEQTIETLVIWDIALIMKSL